LDFADIAAMDHFHTRGIAATKDLAFAAGILPGARVLDIGCGLGGPARLLAKTFNCHVTGIDLSEDFIDAARYLTDRCGLQEQVSFHVGNALDLPFERSSFDMVFLQHVAMNIQDRAGLYKGIARVLAPGGRLAAYDVTLKGGDVLYPCPWARDASGSFLLTEAQTRDALISAGFNPIAWRDDSEVALNWFATLPARSTPIGPTLSTVMGPDFPALVNNLARNLSEGRVGILSAIAESCG